MTNLLALPSETILEKDYKIRRVLGAGGFGITYLAEEIPLQRKVTIKEYFPSEYAARVDDIQAVPRSKDCAGDYKWGLDRFIEEAQTLAKFEHPNIVRVFRYFRANKTGYMVLQWEEGVSLRHWLKDLKRAPRQAELDALIEPLLSALEVIHKSDYLHRDIAPDNIIVRKDKSPVLIDFGSARGDIAHQSRTVSALVKPGYSPYEQYASTTSNQGPWSDIYALGATLYQAVTGKRPPDSPGRKLKDEYLPAREAAIGSFRPTFLAAIDHALKVEPNERPQSVAAWRGPLLAPLEAPPVAKGRGTLGFGLRRQAQPEAQLAQPSAPLAVEAAQPVAPFPAIPAPVAPKPVTPVPGMVAAADATPADGRGPMDDHKATAAPTPGRLKTRLDAVHPSALQVAASGIDASTPPNPRYGLGYGPAPMTQLAQPAQPAALPPAAPARSAIAPPSRMTAALGPADVRRTEIGPPEIRQPAATQAAASKLDAPIPVPVKKRRGPLSSRALFFLRQPWRGYLFKFSVGIAVASLAVAYQNSLPPLPAGTATDPSASSKSAGSKASDKKLTEKASDKATAAASALPQSLLKKLEPKLVLTMPAHRGAVVAMGLRGRELVTIGVDGQARVSNIDTGELSRTVPLVGPPAQAPVAATTAAAPVAPPVTPAMPPAAAAPVPMSPPISAMIQEATLLTAHSDGSIALWDLDKGERIASTRRLDGAVTAVAFTGDTDRVAVAGADGKLMLLDRKSGATSPATTSDGHREPITAMVYVEERNGLLTASADKTIRAWNADTLSKRRTHAGHRDAVSALDVAPDGKTFASGAEDGQVRIWSTLSRSVRRTLKAHDAKVTTLAYAPGGDMLASGASDGLVKLWDPKSGKEIGVIPAKAGAVRALVFTAGSRRLVVASEDGSVKAWDVGNVRVARNE